MIGISIIVPVYNVENYLADCLDSLLKQTYKNIEIIVINDGSPDRSQKIIDQYAKKDSRIVPLIKENGGLSDTRNFGIKHARGKYIGFIDGDDYVEPDMCEKMYKKAIKENSDIVECNLFHNYPDKFDVEIGKKIYDPHEMIRMGRSVAWNKLYKREWLKSCDVWFTIGILNEDVEFYIKLVPFIHKISYVKEAGVHYVFRRESLMNNSTSKVLDIFKVFENIEDYYREKNIYQKYQADIEYLAIRIILCNTMIRLSKIKDKKERKWAFRENWRKLNEMFPDWKKNLYLKMGKTKKEYYMKIMNPIFYWISANIFTILFWIQCKKNQINYNTIRNMRKKNVN